MYAVQLLGQIWKQTYRYSLSLLYASVFSFFIFGITSLSSSNGALIAYFSFVIVFHIVVLTAFTGFWSYTKSSLKDTSSFSLSYEINMGLDARKPRRKKTGLQGFANNKAADQPAHPRSLISTFVIRKFGKYHI